MAVSCERIIEQNRLKNESENYTSPFQGKWSGTYSNNGEVSNFQLTVYKSGNVEVSRPVGNSFDTLYGIVGESGVLNSVQSASSGFILNGNLQTKTGVWKQGSASGTWTIIKN